MWRGLDQQRISVATDNCSLRYRACGDGVGSWEAGASSGQEERGGQHWCGWEWEDALSTHQMQPISGGSHGEMGLMAGSRALEGSRGICAVEESARRLWGSC